MFAVAALLTSHPWIILAQVQKPPTKTNAKTEALTNKVVIDMVAAGLSADVVVAAIREATAKQFDTSPGSLIGLKKSGVPDAVISAMINGGTEVRKPPSTSPIPNVSRSESPRNAMGMVIIPDGTEVRLRLLHTVSSAAAKVDETIRFEAAEDVLVNDKVVIAAGAQGTGTVTEARGKKSFGRRGRLNFTIDLVKAVDGQSIRLRTAKKLEGDESHVKAGVVTYLAGPFGALVKGKDVVVEAGTTYTIFIDGQRRITLK